VAVKANATSSALTCRFDVLHLIYIKRQQTAAYRLSAEEWNSSGIGGGTLPRLGDFLDPSDLVNRICLHSGGLDA